VKGLHPCAGQRTRLFVMTLDHSRKSRARPLLPVRGRLGRSGVSDHYLTIKALVPVHLQHEPVRQLLRQTQSLRPRIRHRTPADRIARHEDIAVRASS
jgi:hypothetical protein